MNTLPKQITPLVRVKGKFQVTIPTKVREAVHLAVGDFLEVGVKESAIMLKPKTIIDREIDKAIAEGMEDVKKGSVSPIFSSAKAAIRYLHRQAKGVRLNV